MDLGDSQRHARWPAAMIRLDLSVYSTKVRLMFLQIGTTILKYLLAVTWIHKAQAQASSSTIKNIRNLSKGT